MNGKPYANQIKGSTMKIEKLILEGYRQLMLSDTHYFEYTPKQCLQLILGTNGSGKTSVLFELTPYPAHHSCFITNGRKCIEIEHEGKHYVLDSKYPGGSGNHSFYCVDTDEEMNPGATYRIQQQLVDQVFGWDKDLMELMLGATSFTSMSTNQRREWLKRLCVVDMDRSFATLKAASSQQRDARGTIAQIGKRLIQEAKEQVDFQEIDRLKAEVKTHHAKLEELYPKRRPLKNVSVELDKARARCDEDAAKYLRRSVMPPHGLFFANQGDVTAYLRKEQEEAVRLKQKYKGLLENIDQLTRELAQLDTNDGVTLEEAEKHVKELDAQIAIQQEKQFAPTRLPVVSFYGRGFDFTVVESLYRRFSGLLSTIPDNEQALFSQESRRKAEEKYRTLNGMLEAAQHDVKLNRERLARMKACEEVECPRCHHDFKPGVNPRDPQLCEDKIKELHDKIDKLLPAIEETQTFLNDLGDYLNYVGQFRELFNQHDYCVELKDYCIEHKVAFRTPRAWLTDLESWFERSKVLYEIGRLEKTRSDYADRIAFFKNTDTAGIKRRRELLCQLEGQLHDTQLQQNDVRNRIVRIEQYIVDKREEELAGKRLLERYQQLLSDVKDTFDNAFQAGLSEEIQTHQTAVALLEEKLHQHAMKEGGRQALERQKTDAERDQYIYGLIVDALSPIDGLIGRYLKSSMGNVVSRMNALISRIWSYPLEVLTSPLEKDELTYKFPLNADNGAVIAPDIKQGSSAQRDIVNFAFKLTVMSILKRTDFPLYLDELGASFDEKHRIQLIDCIESMMENEHLHQVFFISHYAATHGAFSHADVAVLDPRNITVPRQYNQHVKFSK